MSNYPWHIDALRVTDYWDRGLTGKGIKVAIIDEGIGYHASLTVEGGVDLSGEGDYREYVDGNYHGLVCATTLASKRHYDTNGNLVVGIAPDIELYSVKVKLDFFEEDGANKSVARVIQAIDWCLENNIDIISSSFALPETEELTLATQNAIDSGIIFINAMGNADMEIPDGIWASYIYDVISISGVERDSITGKYNRTYMWGDGIDFIIPAKGLRIPDNHPTGSSIHDGTSLSAPMMAGIFAMYMEAFPAKTNIEIFDMIKNSAMKLDTQTEEWDIYHGWGMPQPSPEILAMDVIENSPYLYMDGVDDWINSATGNIVVMDILVPYTQLGKMGFFTSGNFNLKSGIRPDGTIDISSSSSVVDYMYINETEVLDGDTFKHFGERVIIMIGSNSAVHHLNLFSYNNGLSGFLECEVYDVKIYDGGNLRAHYDMSTGTVLDQTINRRHATLNGGTWVLKDNEDKNPPIVNIISVDKSKISNRPNMDRANILFKFGFDQDIQSWQARVLGSDHKTGFLADSGGSANAGDELIAEIHWSDLYSEGENRVNIYGQGLDGSWTPYNDEREIIVNKLPPQPINLMFKNIGNQSLVLTWSFEEEEGDDNEGNN